MKLKLNKYLKEEMMHHDKVATFYEKRNRTDYIWEVPAEKFLLKPPYIRNNITILDMGCGPAIFINRMIRKYKLKSIQYIGVDISLKMLQIAKKYVPSGMFIQADMENFMLKGIKADVVLSLGALHHSLNKKNTIESWNNMLKRSGYILLREPTKDSLKMGSGESPNEEGIDVIELTNIAKKLNLKVVKIIYFWSPLFHIINKILIKLKMGNWRYIKFFWLIFLQIDRLCIFFIKLIYQNYNGDSVAIVLQKL